MCASGWIKISENECAGERDSYFIRLYRESSSLLHPALRNPDVILSRDRTDIRIEPGGKKNSSIRIVPASRLLYDRPALASAPASSVDPPSLRLENSSPFATFAGDPFRFAGCKAAGIFSHETHGISCAMGLERNGRWGRPSFFRTGFPGSVGHDPSPNGRYPGLRGPGRKQGPRRGIPTRSAGWRGSLRGANGPEGRHDRSAE